MTPDTTTEWLATAKFEGELRFRVGRNGDRVVAEWLGIATLTASRDGTQSTLTFSDDVPLLERDKLAHGAVRILLWQLAGKLGVHASAVAVDGHAITFVGASGQGKSTIAAGFCQRGATLLADDAVALSFQGSEVRVNPVEVHHWLDVESLGALGFSAAGTDRRKTAIRAARSAEESLPLAAVVELVWEDGAPSLTPARGIDALARLIPHLCRLLVDSPSHHRAELDLVEQLLATVPFYVLRRPKAFEVLPSTIDEVTAMCLGTASR